MKTSRPLNPAALREVQYLKALMRRYPEQVKEEISNQEIDILPAGVNEEELVELREKAAVLEADCAYYKNEAEALKEHAERLHVMAKDLGYTSPEDALASFMGLLDPTETKAEFDVELKEKSYLLTEEDIKTMVLEAFDHKSFFDSLVSKKQIPELTAQPVAEVTQLNQERWISLTEVGIKPLHVGQKLYARP